MTELLLMSRSPRALHPGKAAERAESRRSQGRVCPSLLLGSLAALSVAIARPAAADHCQIDFQPPSPVTIAQGGAAQVPIQYQTSGPCSWQITPSIEANPLAISGSFLSSSDSLQPNSGGLILGTLTAPQNASLGTYQIRIRLDGVATDQGQNFEASPVFLPVDVTVAAASSPVVPKPQITGYTATNPRGASIFSAPPGAPMLIEGSNLGTGGSVAFNGIAATTSSWSPTEILVTVPTAPSYPFVGPLTVITNGQTATGPQFTITLPSTPPSVSTPPKTLPFGIYALVVGLPDGAGTLQIPFDLATPGGVSAGVTPFTLPMAEGTPIVVCAPPTEMLGTFPLQFEGWASFSAAGERDLGTSPTLTGTISDLNNVVALYQAEPGANSIVNQTDDGHGHRTTTTTWYDGQGHEIGKTIVDEVDGGNGTITTTTTTYDDQGHETGKTSVLKTDDGHGHKTTTTTTYDGQGHETGTTLIDQINNSDGGTTTTTTTTDGQGHLVAKTTIDLTDDGKGHRTTTTTNTDAQGNTTGKTIDDVIDDGKGNRTTTSTTYDGAGIKTGTTIIVETNDGKGTTTKTTTWYDANGHDIGKTVIVGTDNGQGHRTTTTTTYDGQGHETGKLIVDEVDNGNGTTTRTTTTYDGQGHETGRDVRSVPTAR